MSCSSDSCLDSAGDTAGPPMSPQFALAVGLIYCLSFRRPFRDGDLAALRHRLGCELGDGWQDAEIALLINRGGAYAERTSFDHFLAVAARSLDERQRLCLFLNMVECAASDGALDLREGEVLMRSQRAFHIPDGDLRELVRPILLKALRPAFGFGPQSPNERG